jgi:hypothetical protein
MKNKISVEDEKLLEALENFKVVLVDTFETHVFKPSLPPLPEKTQSHRKRC